MEISRIFDYAHQRYRSLFQLKGLDRLHVVHGFDLFIGIAVRTVNLTSLP
jgi:hypothetical protein